MWSGCPHTLKPHRRIKMFLQVKCHREDGRVFQIQGPAYRRNHLLCHGGKNGKGMAVTEKPGDGQTQRLWPVGHNTKDRGRLQHAVPDRLSDTTETRGEDHEVYSPLPNGNVPVLHPSGRWGYRKQFAAQRKMGLPQDKWRCV